MTPPADTTAPAHTCACIDLATAGLTPAYTAEAQITGTLAAIDIGGRRTDGRSLATLLVAVRTPDEAAAGGRRIDRLPITVWQPTEAVLTLGQGNWLTIDCHIQRRFWTDTEGRHSRIELVAHRIDLLAECATGTTTNRRNTSTNGCRPAAERKHHA